MTRSDAFGFTRARGAFVLTVGFVILLSSAIWLYRAILGVASYQTLVLTTQNHRDAVFRALIDQETSMRGFTSTREIRFLRRYGYSQAIIDRAFALLKSDLATLGTPDLLHLVDDQIAVHRKWHDQVAAPLLANPSRPDATHLQDRGTYFVDEFRADDRRIAAGIRGAGDTAVNAVNTALIRITIVTSVLGITFAAVFFYFSAQRSRLLAETARQRMLYENEKRIADALQSAFVQKALPIIPNLGFHASYIPASTEAQVGGDWYDAFELPDGRILFSIGDVAGHGIEAAVIMSRARQAIISNALNEHDPAIVLSRANEALMLQEPKMVTAICGYIDPRTLTIHYATAGHPPPVLAFPGSEPYFLEHDGMPLGIMSNVHYGSFKTSAQPGALLILYTDGVIEHKRDLFDGEKRLLDAARMVIAQGAADPASSVRQTIFADNPPVDDVAIMTVSFNVYDNSGVATINAVNQNRLTVTAS
jgi:CHASE3 domain sensor protein